MTDEILTLFTYHGKSEILKKGFIGNWRLNKDRAKKCTYAVCVQLHGSWGKPENKANQPFLIVKISDISIYPNSNPEESIRYRIHFEEYAEIHTDKKIAGSANPVVYWNEKDAEQLGIDDINAIEFTNIINNILQEHGDSTPPPPHNDTLTIPEAKRRLALTLGVKESDITITINH